MAKESSVGWSRTDMTVTEAVCQEEGEGGDGEDYRLNSEQGKCLRKALGL